MPPPQSGKIHSLPIQVYYNHPASSSIQHCTVLLPHSQDVFVHHVSRKRQRTAKDASTSIPSNVIISDDVETLGSTTMKAVLKAVCYASPDILPSQAFPDSSVYVPVRDQPSSSSSLSATPSYMQPGSSPSSPSTSTSSASAMLQGFGSSHRPPLHEGKGLLSIILSENDPGKTLVKGRLVQSLAFNSVLDSLGRRRKASNESENEMSGGLEALMRAANKRKARADEDSDDEEKGTWGLEVEIVLKSLEGGPYFGMRGNGPTMPPGLVDGAAKSAPVEPPKSQQQIPSVLQQPARGQNSISSKLATHSIPGTSAIPSVLARPPPPKQPSGPQNQAKPSKPPPPPQPSASLRAGTSSNNISPSHTPPGGPKTPPQPRGTPNMPPTRASSRSVAPANSTLTAEHRGDISAGKKPVVPHPSSLQPPGPASSTSLPGPSVLQTPRSQLRKEMTGLPKSSPGANLALARSILRNPTVYTMDLAQKLIGKEKFGDLLTELGVDLEQTASEKDIASQSGKADTQKEGGVTASQPIEAGKKVGSPVDNKAPVSKAGSSQAVAALAPSTAGVAAVRGKASPAVAEVGVSTSAIDKPSPVVFRCDNCGTTETSLWRTKTTQGKEKRVCDDCGVYFNDNKKMRPKKLWGLTGDAARGKAKKGESKEAHFAKPGDAKVESDVARNLRKRNQPESPPKKTQEGLPDLTLQSPRRSSRLNHTELATPGKGKPKKQNPSGGGSGVDESPTRKLRSTPRKRAGKGKEGGGGSENELGDHMRRNHSQIMDLTGSPPPALGGPIRSGDGKVVDLASDSISQTNQLQGNLTPALAGPSHASSASGTVQEPKENDWDEQIRLFFQEDQGANSAQADAAPAGSQLEGHADMGFDIGAFYSNPAHLSEGSFGAALPIQPFQGDGDNQQVFTNQDLAYLTAEAQRVIVAAQTINPESHEQILDGVGDVGALLALQQSLGWGDISSSPWEARTPGGVGFVSQAGLFPGGQESQMLDSQPSHWQNDTGAGFYGDMPRLSPEDIQALMEMEEAEGAGSEALT